MERIVARVRNGRLVVDAPTDLPDGTEVELEPVEDLELTSEERRRLDAAIRVGFEQIERGEGIPAEEVIRRLRARA